jgi:hypothetical protein
VKKGVLSERIRALDSRVDVRLRGTAQALELKSKENNRRIRQLEKTSRHHAKRLASLGGRDSGISMLVTKIIAISALVFSIFVYFRG